MQGCACVCVCVVIPASSTSASPPGNFAILLPPLFLHLAAHLLHFLQLKSKLSSIRSICRLGRESATPLLSSPSHLLITSSQASHEPLWASSSLVTHTHTHIRTSYATFRCFSHFQFEIAAAAASPLPRPRLCSTT